MLAAGITRTLLLLSARLSDFRAAWSLYAEVEAARHQPAGARPISEVRELHDLETMPDSKSPIELTDTDAKDQPILAAAAAAGARFVVTENVKDFGAADLERLQMSAVHPDLFLTVRVPEAVYLAVLDALARNRTREPLTPTAIHAIEVAGKLPGLFARHRTALGVDAATPAARPAKRQFRGVRCVSCERVMDEAEGLAIGLCPACRRQAAGL